MDYRAMYPWASETLLGEASIYTSHEEIERYMKNERPKKYIFGRENDKGLKFVPCRKADLVCCDESSDPMKFRLTILCTKVWIPILCTPKLLLLFGFVICITFEVASPFALPL